MHQSGFLSVNISNLELSNWNFFFLNLLARNLLYLRTLLFHIYTSKLWLSNRKTLLIIILKASRHFSSPSPELSFPLRERLACLTRDLFVFLLQYLSQTADAFGTKENLETLCFASFSNSWKPLLHGRFVDIHNNHHSSFRSNYSIRAARHTLQAH